MRRPNFRKSTQSSLPKPEVINEPNSAYPSLQREVWSTILIFAIAVLLALFTKAYIVQPYIVDGQSMQNTLQDHDRLLVDKLPVSLARIFGHSYTPKRGDIVIFNQSGLPGYVGPKQLIKRVIGLPGDHVVVKDGKITIYDKPHPGGFNPDTSLGYHAASNTPGGVDLTLAQNQLFVCGDNRTNSEDSRYFGPIDLSQVVGRLAFRIYPFGKIQHY